MWSRERRDVLSSIVCAGFGALFCLGSIRYGDVRAGIPSAGFFPCIGGAVLILLSVIELCSALTRLRAAGQGTKRPFFPQRDSWRRLLVALLALFGYGLILEHLGLLVTTFFFVVFIMKFIEPQRWQTSIVMAAVSSTLLYVLFDLCLRIELPKGIFGI